MKDPGVRSDLPVLILGLGNELVSDDGFGPAVARACREVLTSGAGAVGPGSDKTVAAAGIDPDPGAEMIVTPNGLVRIETAAAAGLRLLDLLPGHERALIIDVVQTGRHPAGTVMEWPMERASSARTLGGSHQADLGTTLTLGRSLGYDIPREIVLLVAEAEDLLTIREELTPSLRPAVWKAATLALEWLNRSAHDVPAIGGNHDETRDLP
jgi:hydrogenase maturation protease